MNKSSPRNHRELTPRSLRLGEFSLAVRVVAKSQDVGQVTMEHGVNALAAIPRMQLDTVDQGSEHLCGFVPDGGARSSAAFRSDEPEASPVGAQGLPVGHPRHGCNVPPRWQLQSRRSCAPPPYLGTEMVDEGAHPLGRDAVGRRHQEMARLVLSIGGMVLGSYVRAGSSTSSCSPLRLVRTCHRPAERTGLRGGCRRSRHAAVVGRYSHAPRSRGRSGGFRARP